LVWVVEVMKSVKIDSLGLRREGRRSASWARRNSVGLELVRFSYGYSCCGDGESVLGLRGFEDVLKVDAIVIIGNGKYIWSLVSP
jgi:hypothetical protein